MPRYDSPVAVTARPALDAQKLRADFPIFEQEIHGKPLAYLDSAVELAEAAPGARRAARLLRDLVRERPPRRLPALGARDRGATRARARRSRVRQRARRRARSSSRAARPRRSTSSPTPGASTTSAPATSSLVTELEHHSNFVPWQYIAKRTGADFRLIPLDDNGELGSTGSTRSHATGNVKVVATNLVSNALGTINPVERLGAWAHEQRRDHGRRRRAGRAAPRDRRPGSSAATSSRSPRTRCCGPTSVGALWGRAELLEQMAPFNLGGHMIRSVDARGDDLGRAAVQVRGRHAADRRGGRLRRRDRLPRRRRARGDRGARARAARLRARAARASVPGSSRYGPPPERRAGIVSFNVEGIHPHDVAQMLDMEGVAIRAGHHCCQPLMTQARRRGDEPRELLPLHDARGDRPARRRPAQGPEDLLAVSRVRPALPGSDPRSLQEPARARGARATPTRRPRARTRSAATRSRSTSRSARTATRSTRSSSPAAAARSRRPRRRC